MFYYVITLTVCFHQQEEKDKWTPQYVLSRCSNEEVGACFFTSPRVRNYFPFYL